MYVSTFSVCSMPLIPGHLLHCCMEFLSHASEFVTESYSSHDFVHHYVIPLQLPGLCLQIAWTVLGTCISVGAVLTVDSIYLL